MVLFEILEGVTQPIFHCQNTPWGGVCHSQMTRRKGADQAGAVCYCQTIDTLRCDALLFTVNAPESVLYYCVKCIFYAMFSSPCVRVPTEPLHLICRIRSSCKVNTFTLFWCQGLELDSPVMPIYYLSLTYLLTCLFNFKCWGRGK